jgi:uncharacterized phage protein gp47/JayE
MPFDRPTLQEISDRIVNDIKSRVTGGVELLRNSMLSILARAYAGAIHLVYGFLNYIARQLFITTAEGQYLDIHANEYGLQRKDGSKAIGQATATGGVGKIIPAGTKLSSDSGNIYYVDEEYTLDAAGTVTISFTAEEVGDDYEDDGGVILSFTSPISYINNQVTVTSDGIHSATDEETDDELRARTLAVKRQAPHGGSEFDYENWALEVDGVTRAWSIPEYMGYGTVGLAFAMDDEDSPVPNEAQKTIVEAYIDSHTDPITNAETGIPVAAKPGFFMIPLKPLSVNFVVKLQPNNATVQAAVESRLSDLITTYGGPAETISISQMYEATASATGEIRSTITTPSDDVTAAVDELHVLGSVTFEDY